MKTILSLLALAIAMVEVTAFTISRDSNLDKFLMQSDPHGWFGDIIGEKRSGVPRGCGNKPADVYFVLDTSDDVTEDQFQRQKQYITELSALFHMKEDTTRVGILSYGSTPITVARLAAHKNNERLQEAIKVTPRVGGSRDTAQVLAFLRRKAFSPMTARQEVAHVAIFLTSGYSDNSKETYSEARLLKKTGAYVYAVSLGGKVDKGELTDIASSPAKDFIFGSDDFNIVESLIDLLVIHECSYQIQPPSSEKEPACSAKRPVDITFALEYLALGSKNAKAVLGVIRSFIEEFDTTGNIETGVIMSRAPSQGGLRNRVEDVKVIKEKVNQITFPDLSALLRRTRRALVRGRKGVQKTAVVFLDSGVPLTQSAFIEAKRNKFLKIETYVVFVGNDYNKEDLNLVSNGVGSDHILIVPSYQELDIARDEILSAICRGL